MRENKTIKFFDYPRLLLPYKGMLHNELESSLNDGIFVNGPSVSKFESEYAEYTGAKYAVGVSSGTDGLLAILMSLNLPKGSDVLVTSYTFIASSEAILVAGYNPIFVDIGEGSFHPTLKNFEDVWTENTKAIMYVHLFGETPSLKGLQNMCDERGVILFEDAAESFGSYYPEGGHSGTKTIAASFSFFPAKTLGCLGDGGVVITDDEEIYKKLKMVRAHGSRKRYFHEMIGGNMRLDSLQSRFLSVLLKGGSAEWLKKRYSNAMYYFEHINNPLVQLPHTKDTPENHSWYLFSLVVKGGERDGLQEHLTNNGIETFIYWPIPLHKQPVYVEMFGEQTLPESEKRCKEVLHIPISPHLEEEELRFITEKINEYK